MIKSLSSIAEEKGEESVEQYPFGDAPTDEEVCVNCVGMLVIVIADSLSRDHRNKLL